VSPKLASVARTVPVTAPVLEFGTLTATFEMTGAELATAAALGVANWPVDTVTAGATTVFGTPS
jgi:hypothetical protein